MALTCAFRNSVLQRQLLAKEKVIYGHGFCWKFYYRRLFYVQRHLKTIAPLFSGENKLLNNLLHDVQFVKKKPNHKTLNEHSLLCNVLLQGQYHLRSSSFDVLLNRMKEDFPRFSARLLKLIFCHYLETGNVQEAEKFLETYSNQININIEKIPASMLAVDKPAMRKFLMKYITDKEGHDRAVWIMYTSLLKANLIEDASKVFTENPNVPISSVQLETLLSELDTQDVLADRYGYLVKHCKHVYDLSVHVYKACIESLLKKQEVNKASTFLKNMPAIIDKLHFMVYASFVHNNMPPPSYIEASSPQHKDLINAIFKNKRNLKEVLLKLKAFIKKRHFVHYHIIFALFMSLHVDDYEPAKETLKTIIIGFNPEEHSALVISHIKKLIHEGRKTEAIEFAIDHNHKIKPNEIQIYIKKLLQIGYKNNIPQLLDTAVTCGGKGNYAYYVAKLVSGEKFAYRSSNCKIDMQDLTKFLLETADIHFDEAFNIAFLQCSRNSLPLKYFIAGAIANGCTENKATYMLKKANFKPFDKIFLMNKTYKTAKNFEHLKAIDCLFRCTDFSNLLWHKTLNVRLFNTFYDIVNSDHVDVVVDDNIVDYMIKCYHKIHLQRNHTFVTKVYIDLVTMYKYGNRNSNQLECKQPDT